MAGPILGAILIAAILRLWHRAPRQAGERNQCLQVNLRK
jgi:hypothetical protein